jgi:hypothetical protein
VRGHHRIGTIAGRFTYELSVWVHSIELRLCVRADDPDKARLRAVTDFGVPTGAPVIVVRRFDGATSGTFLLAQARAAAAAATPTVAANA